MYNNNEKPTPHGFFAFYRYNIYNNLLRTAEVNWPLMLYQPFKLGGLNEARKSINKINGRLNK